MHLLELISLHAVKKRTTKPKAARFENFDAISPHIFLLRFSNADLAGGRYGVERVLARRVSVGRDRVDNWSQLTNGCLALMLDVLLTNVTDALHRLEGDHAIDTDRALVGIKDVEKLLELAGAIYGIAEPEFSR